MDPTLLLADLEAKPEALERLAARFDRGNPFAALTLPGEPKRVVFLGMGSSRYAAGVAALRLRAAGIDAVAEYASTVASHPPSPGALVVAISASGESPETLDAASRYAGRSPVLAITNDPTSSLAGSADHVVELVAGDEISGIASRTFQHTGLVLRSLEALLTGRPDGTAALTRRVTAATRDLLERRGQWLPPVLVALDGPDGVFVLAPAERLASAEQAALMIREAPRRLAVACETGDWSHVDVYLAKTLDYRALLFAGSRWDGQALEWLGQHGSTVVAIGGDVPGAAAVVRYAGDTDTDVAAHMEVLVGELVAADWAASSRP